MREILGAYRKKPITQKSLLWNFEISISEWCVISQLTWPLGLNNPFWNRFINGFITAILKKSTFPENPIGTKKFSELHRRIDCSTITQKVEMVVHSNVPVKWSMARWSRWYITLLPRLSILSELSLFKIYWKLNISIFSGSMKLSSINHWKLFFPWRGAL